MAKLLILTEEKVDLDRKKNKKKHHITKNTKIF